MGATTWTKFFWSDWESDEALKLCSPGAQALWMRMLCVCAKTEGFLTIGGETLDAAGMARLTGWPLKDVRKWWAELARWKVFSIDRKGVVYSRRMTKDAKRSRIGKETGQKGGNPNLRKDEENSRTLNGHANGRSGRSSNSHKPNPQTPSGGFHELPDWSGPDEVRCIVADRMGDVGLRRLRGFGWRDVPDRVLTAPNGVLRAKLAECEADLSAAGWKIIIEKGQAA